MHDDETCEYFLDTSVYVGYATEWDQYYEHCKRMLDGDYSKNSSVTVENEINELIRDYRHYLQELSKKDGDIDVMIKAEQNPNRRRFLEQVKEHSSKNTRDNYEVLSKIRLSMRILIDGILEAFGKTKKPLIPASSNYTLIESLTFIGDRNDAQILADAAGWSKNMTCKTVFCTKDMQHIVKNAVTILKIITRDSNGACQLQIRHINTF
jgi:hypothetical protein